MKKVLYIGLALSLLAIGALAGMFVKYLRPWVTTPELDVGVVNEKWARVEGWAAADPSCRPMDQSLAGAAKVADHEWSRISELEEGARYRIETDNTTPQLQAAVAALVVWYEGRGGVGIARCGGLDNSFDLLDLGLASLAFADESESRPSEL